MISIVSQYIVLGEHVVLLTHFICCRSLIVLVIHVIKWLICRVAYLAGLLHMSVWGTIDSIVWAYRAP